MRSPLDEDFHDLVSAQYESSSTIVTSNLDFTEWGSAFPNQLLAAVLGKGTEITITLY